MKNLEVRLFGRLSITYESQSVAGLESTKVQELLCYLLLHRDRPYPRSTLASILWGDACTTSNSRKYLRNALWRIRSALRDMPDLENLITTDGDWVELRSSPALSIDAEAFENAYTLSQRKRVSGLSISDATDIELAIGLYTGCLLANWTCDWCVSTRDRLHQHYLAMLDKLADYAELQADYMEVLHMGERLLESDPAHERTHRRLMRVYHKTGDRTNALRQYARCVDALRSELGIEPGPKTQAVLSKICDGRQPVVNLLPPSVDATERRPIPTSAV